MQRKMLQSLSNENSILHMPAWLPPNNEPKKSIPCTIPISRLIFKLEQKNKSKHVPKRHCPVTENIFPSPGRGCDGKQMAKSSSRFGIKIFWWMAFLFRNVSVKKCTLARPHCAQCGLKKTLLMETVLRAGINILQMICRGGIPFQAMVFCTICH